jgi:hypothetical protein
MTSGRRANPSVGGVTVNGNVSFASDTHAFGDDETSVVSVPPLWVAANDADSAVKGVGARNPSCAIPVRHSSVASTCPVGLPSLSDSMTFMSAGISEVTGAMTNMGTPPGPVTC